MALKRRFLVWFTISLVSACLAFSAATAEPASAQVAPPTLTGEQFFACSATFSFGVPESGCGLGTPIGSTVTERACDFDTGGDFSFTASGIAIGPYPGTFSEVGTVEVDGFNEVDATQPVLSFESSFTIDSPIGQVEGTKLLLTSIAGNCTDLTGIAFVAVTYEATITTAEGQFEDRGTGSALVYHATGGDPQNIFGFHETFTSELLEPAPVGCPPGKGEDDEDGDDDDDECDDEDSDGDGETDSDSDGDWAAVSA